MNTSLTSVPNLYHIHVSIHSLISMCRDAPARVAREAQGSEFVSLVAGLRRRRTRIASIAEVVVAGVAAKTRQALGVFEALGLFDEKICWKI